MKTQVSTLNTVRRPGERLVGLANGSARRSASARIRIVVVDDHPITLAGLHSLLSADFTVVARCAQAHEALRAVRMYEPDVLVIDQDMPVLGGVDVLKQLRAAHDKTPSLLPATAASPQLTEALPFTVEGIAFKQPDPNPPARCLREVHGGRRWLAPSVNEYAAPPPARGETLETLTRRQIEVA